MKEKIKKVVVTTQPALVEYLLELGLINKNVKVLDLDHATETSVKGKHVFGFLSHSLSCLTAAYTEITLFLPTNLRGVELNLEQIKHFALGTRTYTVLEIK